MLIGDVIIASRELCPDMPSTLPAPTGLVATPYTDVNGTIPPGTYFLVATYSNPWGETSPSNEVSVTIVLPNNAINVSAQANAAPNLVLAGAFYIGTSAGNEYLRTTTGQLSSPVNIISLPVIGGYPPSRNTAFNPDGNGRFASAYTFYRWLNDGLTTAAYICKGIPDTSGIQTIRGQGFYTFPGIWERLENIWFDGFPIAWDARSGAFYRNALSGITFIGILQTNSDRQICEFQPQPNRTGGSTTLSVAAGINDSSIQCAGTASFGLGLGMFQMGTEVCSYGTITGGGLAGLARGLGGTQQSAWPIGTPVIELNFRFGGLRLNSQTQYIPGGAFTTLQVPPGWKPALVDYLVGKFREAEKKDDSAKASLQKFTAFCKEYLKGTKQTAGPRQLGSTTPAGDGYPSASSGGRIIVP